MRNLTLGLWLAAFLPLAACGGGEKVASLPPSSSLPPVAPAQAGAVGEQQPAAGTPGSEAHPLRAMGELRARNEAQLAPEVAGRIVRFRADVGDRVRKGDVLVDLDDASARAGAQQARAALAMAEAALENAASQHRRAKALAQGEAASASMLEQASIGEKQAAAAREQAAAALLSAETFLAKHVIRAPFDALVTARTRSAGEFVSNMPPSPVIGLVDPASIEVRAGVPETVVDQVAVGDVVTVTVSPSGKAFQARVRAIGAAVEPGTRTVDLRADPLPPAPRELRHGAIIELSKPQPRS